MSFKSSSKKDCIPMESLFILELARAVILASVKSSGFASRVISGVSTK